MFTLCIVLIFLLMLGIIALVTGAATVGVFSLIFGDLIIAAIVVIVVIKLVCNRKKKRKNRKED